MIGVDTITLSFSQHEFAVLRAYEFTPNLNLLTKIEPKDMGKGKLLKSTRNPTKQDNATQGYLPYVTYYRGLRAGGIQSWINVQFSAPKLLYGNNFDELAEDDLEKLYDRLYEALKYYGIRFFKGRDAIPNAKVTVINYSKNIPLTNLMSANEVIREFHKCDVSTWRDVAENGYVNGNGYKAHSKYYEFAVYNKIAEYNKGKRGQPLYDKDLQLPLDLFNDKKIVCDIVRIEVRFNNTRTIRSAVTQAGYKNLNLTFQNLCKKDISQAVLKQQVDNMYVHYPRLTHTVERKASELFSELIVSNPNRMPHTILSAVGLWAINEDIGARRLKDIVGPRGSPALLRLTKKLNDELNFRSEQPETFEVIDDQLDKFERVRLDNFVL